MSDRAPPLPDQYRPYDDPDFLPHTGHCGVQGCNETFTVSGMTPFKQLAELQAQHAPFCVARKRQQAEACQIDRVYEPPTVPSHSYDFRRESAMRSTVGDNDVRMGPRHTQPVDFYHYRDEYQPQPTPPAYQYPAQSPPFSYGGVPQNQMVNVARRRIAIRDLVLDTSVHNTSLPSPTSTMYSSPLSSNASTLAHNSPVFGVAQTFDDLQLDGKGSPSQNALGLEFAPADHYGGYARHGPVIYPTLPPMQFGYHHPAQFPGQRKAQNPPKQHARRMTNSRSPPRASTSKKAAANPVARQKSQAAAKKAQVNRKIKSKTSRSEEERINVLKNNMWIIQFGVVHSVCGGCCKRLAIDGRSRFYPGLYEKHAEVCPGVRAKRLEIAHRKQRGEVVTYPRRTWIYLGGEEEIYVLADENGAPKPIIYGKPKKKDDKQAELDLLRELEVDHLTPVNGDDAEYVPRRFY